MQVERHTRMHLQQPSTAETFLELRSSFSVAAEASAVATKTRQNASNMPQRVSGLYRQATTSKRMWWVISTENTEEHNVWYAQSRICTRIWQLQWLP
jgi:hypothetical protein